MHKRLLLLLLLLFRFELSCSYSFVFLVLMRLDVLCKNRLGEYKRVPERREKQLEICGNDFFLYSGQHAIKNMRMFLNVSYSIC